MAWKDKSRPAGPERAAILIPVRMESKRFPGKPLAMARGKPLLWWAWQAAKGARLAKVKAVATDSAEVQQWCARSEIRCHFDDLNDYATGSDRIGAAMSSFPKAQFVVDLQCDEPDLTSGDLDRLILELQHHSFRQVVTYCYNEPDEKAYADPNNVKVVVDKNQEALHFSRQPLPGGKIHVGVYAYRFNALVSFLYAQSCSLERAEALEQLRLLYIGLPVHVVDVGRKVQSINTPADLKEWNRNQ